MKRLFLLAVAVLVGSNLAYGLTRYVDDADIAPWAWDSVYSLQDQGVITGFDDNTFRPNETINRAQALTIISRAIPISIDKDLVKADPNENFFKDIRAGEWYYQAVLTGLGEGWVKGYGDGTMRPANAVTMAEWATMLARAYDMEESEEPTPFADVSARDWFHSPSQAMMRYGLVRGAPNLFNPHTPVTRQDSAWMINQIIERPEFQQWYIDQQADLAQQARLKKMFAVKETTWNVNDQGFKPEDKGLKMTIMGSEDRVDLYPSETWTELGRIELENPLENVARLDSLDLGIIKDSGFIPEDDFSLLVRVPSTNYEKIVKMENDGKTEVFGLGLQVNPGQKVTIEIAIRLQEGARVRDGLGSVQIFGGEARQNSQDVYEAHLPIVRDGTILGLFQTYSPN